MFFCVDEKTKVVERITIIIKNFIQISVDLQTYKATFNKNMNARKNTDSKCSYYSVIDGTGRL